MKTNSWLIHSSTRTNNSTCPVAGSLPAKDTKILEFKVQLQCSMYRLRGTVTNNGNRQLQCV